MDSTGEARLTIHIRTPRAPTAFSVADLLLEGFVREEDILPTGLVADTTRIAAERAYANHIEQRERRRPSTAGPRLNTSSSTQSRVSRPRRSGDTPRASLRGLQGAASSAVTQSHTSHTRRILQLRDMNSDERDSLSDLERKVGAPQMDVCCICYARPRSHAFEPCHHVCTCAHCASRVRTCPLCRADIHRRFEVFF